MKTSTILFTTLAAASALASQLASADPTTGTITFTGALVADTCVVNTGANNIQVTLPSVETSTLTSAGQTGGNTPFAISLTGCSPQVPVRALFSGSNVISSSGHLQNNGLATNVDLQLLNSASQPIALNGADGPTQGDTLQQTDSTGAATLNYMARYFATGATGAGSVNSNVTYQIIYN